MRYVRLGRNMTTLWLFTLNTGVHGKLNTGVHGKECDTNYI